MSKNILVTGGSGFIGSYVVDHLIKKKYKVTILDLINPKRKDVKFIKASILNKKLIRLALKKNKIIFHLAAVSDINKVKDIPVETISTNILGTTLLLDEAKKANIERFIFASTYYSYGKAGNLYTTSKTSSELIIKNYSLLYDLKYTILRFPTAYGPRNRQVDAISIFVNRALKNLNLIIHGNGNQERNYLYVDDLGEGSVAAINKKLINKTITLAASKNIKITNLAKKIIKLTKSESKIIFNNKKKRLDDFTSGTLNLKKKGILFGWKPKNDLNSGLLKYINYKKNSVVK
jgi:UDP-glucose 4-epimerase